MTVHTKEIVVHLFTEDGQWVRDEGLIVRDLGCVPHQGDCIVAAGLEEPASDNPTNRTIYEVLRRYIISENKPSAYDHVHLLVRGRPGEYEEYNVLGGFDPRNV